ncbi:MAG: DUF2723 domain-containing protein, partial [Chloroflexaceae bacterium]|nr:DUF2723 domain-containing protein [Chloroflexaceae bacterium]
MRFPWILLVFLVCLGGYLTTLTQVHTFDALSYVLDVDQKPWPELLHPHHLAYGPLGFGVRALLERLGWRGSVLVPLQVVNALAGSLGVALFSALVHQVTRRADLALCGALLLGGSYAYWYYAVEVEVYTIAALFLVGCLWLMVPGIAANHDRPPSLTIWAALGVVQGIAVLFHQTNVLLGGVVVLAILGEPRRAADRNRTAWFRGSRGLNLAAYALPFGVVVGGSYLLAGLRAGVTGSWADFLSWTTVYAHTGWWGEAMTRQTWADLGKGVSETLAQPGGAVIGMLLAAVLLWSFRRLVAAHGQLALVLGAWLLCYGVFFTWWEPENIEFWIASLPPFVLLLVLALQVSGPPWHRGVWATLVVGAAMVGVNGLSIAYRGTAAHDIHRRLTQALAQQSKQDDLILVSDELQELNLPYYAGRRNTWSLNQALQNSGGDWDVACGQVQGRIEEALAHGLAVLIGKEVLAPPQEETVLSDPVVSRFGLIPEEVTRCFAAYLPVLVPLEMGEGLPNSYRLPPAQELAEGPGWDFSHIRWGWRAVHVSDERVGPGWSFLPGVDPMLLSPPLMLDTSRYQAVEVRMAVAPGVGANDAPVPFELFFVDAQGQTEASRAVSGVLERGSEAQTCRIALEGQAGLVGGGG